MRIAGARVIVTCPGRNFVTLKVVTDEGLTGVGDATLNGRELAVASYLRDHVCPVLAGLDARHTEATDEVFPHAYHFAGGYLHPGEEPGLGVDIDEARAAAHPYRPAYLPVNRLADGSMHSW